MGVGDLSRCMINHVARSTILHHSQFQNIFQEAAARAYLRDRWPVDVFCTQPSTGTSFRRGHVRTIPTPCAVPEMINFTDSHRTLLAVARLHVRVPAAI
jgi:hypothetical protein